MSVAAAWMAQQLAEFTSVFDGEDDVRRISLALDRVAESFDAEFALVMAARDNTGPAPSEERSLAGFMYD